MLDWSDGDYERTAQVLTVATERVMATAQVSPGMRVIDVGCGTGNAALAAARRGAVVTAVDPAARLLEVGQQRAGHEGLSVSWKQGEAAALPAETAQFDLALSVFAVIFAPDASAAVAEMLRVVRPGGRLVMTSWVNEGGVSEAGQLLWAAMASLAPPDPPPVKREAPRWGDRAFLEQLFGAHGARVHITEERLSFTAASPRAWFEEQEHHHPVWRFVRQSLAARPDTWNEVRERSIERLAAWNLDPQAFRTESRYLVIDAQK